MRLLNTSTLALRVFNTVLPDYAILSHVWGPDEDEVSLQELQSPGHECRDKKGYLKITRFCEVASQNGYQWVWIDTCCIDKASSAELSEAILHVPMDVSNVENVARSRWFSRGWTLQELLAPNVVEFYDKDWNEIGTKNDLKEKLSEITGINETALKYNFNPSRYPVAVKMSWASMRITTREEDVAYSLLGIFDVNMPLLYGEGKKAFQRLQEEIFKTSEDYTLLAWRSRAKGTGDMGRDPTGILARSPWDFRNHRTAVAGHDWSYDQLLPIAWNPSNPRESDFQWRGRPESLQIFPPPSDFEPPRITARGLRATLPFITTMSPSDEIHRQADLAFLYSIRQPKGEMVCLVLHEHDDINSSGAKGHFYRALGGPGVHFVSPQSVTLKFRTVHIRIKPREQPLRSATEELGAYTALVLTGATPPNRLYTQMALNRPNLLIHFQRGSTFVDLLANTMPWAGWCLLSKSASGPYGNKHEQGSEAQLLAVEATNRRQHSLLQMDGAEKIRCVLRSRPEGWLQLQIPGMGPTEMRQVGVPRKVWSLHVWVESNATEANLTLNILGAEWL
ncbi:hypothetical protein BJ170DRAFT_732670 [Xylariales sp. AK1849]|nr:hypothetical protein BJ170DRAFT_732670 [Xylariales sp. AK1849]